MFNYFFFRLVCGIRKKTLIMTFPGSLNACKECFEVVEPVLEHAVDQLQSNILSIQNLHNDKRLLKSKLIKFEWNKIYFILI